VPATRIDLVARTDPALARATSADTRPRRIVSERAEGIALVLLTARTRGLTWPQSKFLLTMLPPFSMRAWMVPASTAAMTVRVSPLVGVIGSRLLLAKPSARARSSRWSEC
jgi:hypothetical protein